MRDRLLDNISGELEILAYRKGKLIHYDKSENTITVFAKHATMHLLTGESFTSWGYGTGRPNQRSEVGGDHVDSGTGGDGINNDGTLLSDKQYFAANNSISPSYGLDWWWSISNVDAKTTEGDQTVTDADIKYPFFPSKMLFGTGFEWNVWSDIPLAYQTQYLADGWTEGGFNANITDGTNEYSSIYSGGIIKTKTMNDIYSGALTTPSIDDTDFAVAGAIKTGDYQVSSPTERGTPGGAGTRTEYDGTYEYLLKTHQGIGDPAFIYSTRVLRNHQAGAEISLSADTYLENKITYEITMPAQDSGTDSGIYYPYNGYTLKVAGLFCDARMLLGNTEPIGDVQDHANEEDNFKSMPYGIMFAKRYISPVTKEHDVSITARWSIYL